MQNFPYSRAFSPLFSALLLIFEYIPIFNKYAPYVKKSCNLAKIFILVYIFYVIVVMLYNNTYKTPLSWAFCLTTNITTNITTNF